MLSSDEFFEAGHVVNALRQSIGDSEFGYRAQGFLAHVLMRLGGGIIDIKPQGHPDITASLGGKTLLIQVKAVQAKMRRQRFVIGANDLEGIRPTGSNDVGYLAIMDCAPPISWVLVDYHILCRQHSSPVHMVTLHAMANRRLSLECTEEFVKLIASHQSHLRDLDFHLICSRALTREPL